MFFSNIENRSNLAKTAYAKKLLGFSVSMCAAAVLFSVGAVSLLIVVAFNSSDTFKFFEWFLDIHVVIAFAVVLVSSFVLYRVAKSMGDRALSVFDEIESKES